MHCWEILRDQYGSKNLSVCLSVKNFDLNYLWTGKIEWSEILFSIKAVNNFKKMLTCLAARNVFASLFFYIINSSDWENCLTDAARLPVSGQGSTPSLTNYITYPLCFTAYIIFDVSSQLSSLKGGGASD